MSGEIQLVPIDQINVPQRPRRDSREFKLVVESVRNLGVKKPIQLCRTFSGGGGRSYDLLCGQILLEVVIALGHKEIPAIVIESSKEERILRKLVGDLVRRRSKPQAVLAEIERLRTSGNSNAEIGEKLNLSESTIGGIEDLRKTGEEFLLVAVLCGRVTLGIALDIARTDSIDAERELVTNYERNGLNPLSVRKIRRLFSERRKLRDQAIVDATPQKTFRTTDILLRAFHDESWRQKRLVEETRHCGHNLAVLVSVMRKLMADTGFVALLKAESLAVLPDCLAKRIAEAEQTA